ncbi:MAG: potassium transporter Kup [Acidimicrobiales bacterium]|nr:potassium transporter Kup [Acidimicrobiales bacterium]
MTTPAPSTAASHRPRRTGGAALALGALGVVFGDIGTSPLYAFREAFEHQDLPVVETNALGVASIAFWALVIIISIKYLALVMRADNHGEGGILALTALVMPRSRAGAAGGLVLLGVFGTALLYGDGLITPAISVLSAVEGFEVASSAFEAWVLPVACAILVGLFMVQKRGTEAVGRVFGPVMVVWFATLGILGLNQIIQHPGVLEAINPIHIVDLFQAEPKKGFLALGSIFLVVTGGEALYADMGHFGRRPIMHVWYAIVLPGLLCNYFGQAALLIDDPEAIESPFYRLAPDWGVTPLALLATMASVIASQALISGAFSLTVQAVQLDFLPRLKVLHTSAHHQGQVYVPLVNWALMVGSVGLVLGFRSSSNLAAAYGIAVTATMVITTVLFFVVVRNRWGWSLAKALLVIMPLLLVDSAFLAANVPKIPAGGWFPLLIGLALSIQMATWRRGRQIVAERIRRAERSVEDVVDEFADVASVPGTAVFLFKDAGKAPPALINNLRHNKVRHEETILLSIDVGDAPHIPDDGRRLVSTLRPGLHQVVLCFGYLDELDIPGGLAQVEVDGRPLDLADATYFVGRESVSQGDLKGMHPALEHLYTVLHRGADSATRFFKLPNERVYEVGTQVEL